MCFEYDDFLFFLTPSTRSWTGTGLGWECPFGGQNVLVVIIPRDPHRRSPIRSSPFVPTQLPPKGRNAPQRHQHPHTCIPTYLPTYLPIFSPPVPRPYRRHSRRRLFVGYDHGPSPSSSSSELQDRNTYLRRPCGGRLLKGSRHTTYLAAELPDSSGHTSAEPAAATNKGR